MGAEVADLYVVLRSVSDPFSKGLKTAAADAESQSRRMSSALAGVAKIGVGLGVAVAGIAVESVKMASTFNAQMAMLNTQAGVSKGQIAGLSSGVLALAGQVGFAPTSLAEALFHVESSFASVGITGPQAMNILKVAAEGAAVGHADLVDVTNALDSAVVSAIPGVQDMSSAMGVLNATVGAGDMTMQDLANAFSTGLLATVKGFGLSITDVGAALAVFGDNNIRGTVAATDLRMAVMAMAKPAASSGAELKKLGLSSGTLAKDMQTGGLLKALEDLKKHMDAAGVSAVQQGQVITDLFGKKAGTGMNVLIDQIDRVKSKYPDLAKGASGFADAWATTKATFAQQMKEIRAEADATAVRLGNFLLPQLSKLLSGAQSGLGQIVSGYSDTDKQPVKNPKLGNAFLNQDMAKPPELTGWQKFGEETHRIFTDIEHDVAKLKPVGMDFVRFGEDAYQAAQKLLAAAQPVAQVFGGALLLGVEGVGKALANVAGPAIREFADFLSSHQGEIKFFADVVLLGLITKMTVLGSIKAAQGVIGLATSIAQFPLGQAGQIKTAFDGLKTAWAGKEAVEGKDAVVGLKGAITDLKGAASGALDKFPLFDSGKLAGLAKAGQDISGIEKAAAESGQLGLFETNLKGIVQVAETEQLALFETDLAAVTVEADTAAVATGGLLTTLKGFVLPVAIIAGVGMIGYELGKLAGVGDHTAVSMDTLNSKLQLSGAGSIQARDQFTQTAVSMVDMSNAMGKMGMQTQGLKDVDTSLTRMVTSGHAQDARNQFDDIAAALARQGINAQSAASKFPQYEQAIKDAGDAAQTTDGKLQGMQDALNAQSALTTFNSDLQTLKQQLHDSGHALDSASQSGLQNQRMFQTLAGDVLTYYQNQRTAGTSTADATNTMLKQTRQIEALGKEFGISKGDVDKFLGSLAGIKPQYSTAIGLNTDPAYKALHGLLQTINTSFGTVRVNVNQTGLGMGTNRGAGTPSWDNGGFVPGPKGRAVAGIVHGGEYVISNEMQAGTQRVDPRVLGGMSGGYGRSVGGVAGGMSVVNNYFVTNVAGTVTTERRLASAQRAQYLQYENRNSTNGLSTR